MSIYEDLGVKTLINAAGTYTVIGGSRMSEQTLNAMEQAGTSFVPLCEMQTVVHNSIAQMTRNEAACVTAGAIVGTFLAAAGCISRKFRRPLRYIPKESIEKSELIMFRAHRNPYDRGLQVLGVKLVELGYPNNIDISTPEELERAFTEHTVGMIYLPSTDGGWVPPGALDLPQCIEQCRAHDVPLIVDAAAQLPPMSNLWHFTQELGASAVVFSGGKYIRGPQTTGLVLGKKSFIPWVEMNNFPHFGVGRMHKLGREELAGIYAAVKEYTQTDESEKVQEAEKITDMFVHAFAGSDIFHFERAYPNEAGQPMARAKLIITREGLEPEMIRIKLADAAKSIFCMVENG